MRRINRLGLHNLPWPGRTVEVDVNSGSNFLIFTGYNGAGKSRFISSLLETLSMIKDHDYPAKESQWLMSVLFDDGVEVRAIKARRGNIPHDVVRKKVGAIIRRREDLQKTFAQVEKFLDHENSKNSHSQLKTEGDENRNFCGATLFCDPAEAQEIESSLNVVAYIDNRIHFNYTRKVENAVFDNDVDLDNTLLILITEFISSNSMAEAVQSVVEASVKELMAEYFRKTPLDSLGFDEKKALAYVEEKIDPSRFVLSEEALFAKNDVFKVINEFMAQTKRRLVWDDNSIRLRLCDGSLVDWYDFSRGEKTLLSLFLMVYLYKDSSLFLLDEPETSLHVEWQRKLIPALHKVAPSAQFIIATHSPFLVMNTDMEQVVNLAKYTPDV